MSSSTMRRTMASGRTPSTPRPVTIQTRRSSFATSSSTPSSIPLRPSFHESKTRTPYSTGASGLVVGTSRTAIWLPLRDSNSASVCSSAARCCWFSVPVRSVTRALSGGTATCARATAAKSSALKNNGLVRKFVGIATARREVAREEAGDRLDRLQGALGVLPALERMLHLAADGVPLGLLHPGADAAVGDDLDPAVDELHVDQHAAVVRGVPDAELGEECLGSLSGLEIQKRKRQRRFDSEPQLAVVQGFGRLDRRLDLAQGPGREGPQRQPVRREKVLEEPHRDLLGEIDLRRLGDFLFVFHGELRLLLVPEQHRRQVARERAHRGVVLLRRL